MSVSYKLSDFYKGVTAAIYVAEVAAVLSGKISKQLNNPNLNNAICWYCCFRSGIRDLLQFKRCE